MYTLEWKRLLMSLLNCCSSMYNVSLRGTKAKSDITSKLNIMSSGLTATELVVRLKPLEFLTWCSVFPTYGIIVFRNSLIDDK
jgi:hypothetical protein